MITILRGTVPILYFDSGIVGGTTPTNEIQLSAGSLWIPSQQFVSTTLPSHQFLALKIKSVQILFSGNVTLATKPIVIDPSITATVSAKLESAVTASKHASLQAPDSATFILQNSNTAVLQSASNASMGAFGATLASGFASPIATYDADVEKFAFSGHLSSQALTTPSICPRLRFSLKQA
jgi:hypothetical protein